jgi:hypothetical protein
MGGEILEIFRYLRQGLWNWMKSRKRHELQVKDRDLKIKAEVGACVRHFTANLVVRMSSFLHTASGVDILWLKEPTAHPSYPVRRVCKLHWTVRQLQAIYHLCLAPNAFESLMDSLSKPSRRGVSSRCPNRSVEKKWC